MTPVSILLFGGLIVAFLAWTALTLYVLVVERRRVESAKTVRAVVELLQQDDVRALTADARLARATPLLDGASRALLMRAAAEADVAEPVFEGLAAFLEHRWGMERLLADARAHKSARERWHRTAALRILFRGDHPEVLTLLERAVASADLEVASVALELLGRSADPGAVDVMLAALRQRRFPASQIAVHLEHAPQLFASRLRALLGDPDPEMRFWAATLLGRYTDADGLEEELAPLADDRDARVRKAAVASLGKVGDHLAAATALRLLRDPESFVRAHAARALGELHRVDLAGDVATLLGDTDWWVRRAAMDALEMIGSEVWPVLVRCLDHHDEFVRNGAAEVFQNLGILDSLIIMEAATDNPSPAKIEMLQRITAAGGGRLTDSLIERVGPVVRPRVRRLLETIGLQHVGAA